MADNYNNRGGLFKADKGFAGLLTGSITIEDNGSYFMNFLGNPGHPESFGFLTLKEYEKTAGVYQYGATYGVMLRRTDDDDQKLAYGVLSLDYGVEYHVTVWRPKEGAPDKLKLNVTLKIKESKAPKSSSNTSNKGDWF